MNEIEPGSPVHRVAMLLKAAPDGRLTRAAIAITMAITQRQVDMMLEPGVEGGWLRVGNDSEAGKTYHLGPRYSALQALPPPPPHTATAAVAAAAPATKPQAAGALTRRGRAHLPALDPRKLKVSADVPLPMPAIALRGKTKHDAVFDQLTADGMSVTGIDIAYQAALLKATQAYLNHHPEIKATSNLFVRRTDATHCGIWRVPKSVEDGTQARHRARKANKLKAAA